MKVLVLGAFNQEKALVGARGLLRDYEPSDLLRMELFEALLHVLLPGGGLNLALAQVGRGHARGRARLHLRPPSQPEQGVQQERSNVIKTNDDLLGKFC